MPRIDWTEHLTYGNDIKVTGNLIKITKITKIKRNTRTDKNFNVKTIKPFEVTQLSQLSIKQWSITRIVAHIITSKLMQLISFLIRLNHAAELFHYHIHIEDQQKKWKIRHQSQCFTLKFDTKSSAKNRRRSLTLENDDEGMQTNHNENVRHNYITKQIIVTLHSRHRRPTTQT